MSQNSAFFNSVSGDRLYNAKDFAEYFASFIGNGVFPNPSTSLQAMENSGMAITLREGKAWINGYFYFNTTNNAMTLANADGVLNRIDRIVVKWDSLARTITAQVKSSALATAPVAPALQRDADAYELCIADVFVGAGVTSITQANITDQRLNTSLCGIVASTVQHIDTTTLNAQLQSWYNQFTQNSTDQFGQWFVTVQDILDSSTAGNLLSLIMQGAKYWCASPTGSGDTFNLTSGRSYSALIDGQRFEFYTNRTSAAPSIKVDTAPAYPLRKGDGTTAQNIRPGAVSIVYYNSRFFLSSGVAEYGTAAAAQVLAPYTIGTDNGLVTGTIVNRGGPTFTAGASVQSIPDGHYSGATIASLASAGAYRIQVSASANTWTVPLSQGSVGGAAVGTATINLGVSNPKFVILAATFSARGNNRTTSIAGGAPAPASALYIFDWTSLAPPSSAGVLTRRSATLTGQTTSASTLTGTCQITPVSVSGANLEFNVSINLTLSGSGSVLDMDWPSSFNASAITLY